MMFTPLEPQQHPEAQSEQDSSHSKVRNGQNDEQLKNHDKINTFRPPLGSMVLSKAFASERADPT